ncbi:hypothetical protein BJ546DRAFT_951493 [Cryomyces antarcticus]
MRLATLASSTIFTLTIAAPVLQKRFIEETPWHLTKFFAFTAAPGPDGVSAISFHFCDTNAGIEIRPSAHARYRPGRAGARSIRTRTIRARTPLCASSSRATRSMSRGATGILRKCSPSHLGDGPRGLSVRVAEQARRVGPAGLDIVTAFGSANTTLQTVESYAGTKAWSKSIDVPITALIA